MVAMAAPAPKRDILAGTESALRPPPRLSLSEWADKHYYLSAESAAEPGRWRTLPYQRGIMDAITDPAVEQVTLMKSARVGYTKMVGAAIGYYMHQDPCPILVVQPTVEDAEGYSKEEIAPMLRDCPDLAGLVKEPTAKDSQNTILHKKFPGGVLGMAGANSPRGFRRVSRRVVIFDEVDGYPPSAGTEGDQIELGRKRTQFYWNRKIIAGSTPTTAGASRIETMFDEGDRRRYYVPCPQCGHMDFLTFREQDEGGHFMQWPEGEPERAYFVCRANGCTIEHHQKLEMLERGEWRAAGEFRGHASFHIWAAYSVAPNASWGQIAKEFVEAKGNTEKLKTFVNTGLGQTWTEKGEAPDWERLHARRESYPIGTAPAGVWFLTAGVDVQKDSLRYEVVGWAATKESWSVDAGVIPGDTASDATWAKLEELLARSYPAADGGQLPIAMMAVDSGYNTQQVYDWCRRHPMSRVIAVKGVATQRTIIGAPSPVDVNFRGKRMQRGYKVWPVGPGVAKGELYGWLRLPMGEDGSFPTGWCHFPEYGEEYFKQLTAEHLVKIVTKRGFVVYEWQIQANRENHFLDCRVYARAAAQQLGLDRLPPPGGSSSPPAPQNQPAAAAAPSPDPPAASRPQQTGNWLGGSRPRGGGGDWLRRRR